MIQRIEAEIFVEVRLDGELLRIDFVVKAQDEDNALLDELQCERLLGGEVASWDKRLKAKQNCLQIIEKYSLIRTYHGWEF